VIALPWSFPNLAPTIDAGDCRLNLPLFSHSFIQDFGRRWFLELPLAELPGEDVQVEFRTLVALFIFPSILSQRALEENFLPTPGVSGEILCGATPNLQFDKGRHFLPLLLTILVRLVMSDRGIHDLGFPDLKEFRISSQVTDYYDAI
jgi:hypothetical protein